MKRTFVANAELVDELKGVWIVTIPEIDAATQGYGLDDARLMARDLVTCWLDLPDDTFDVDLRVS